MENRMIGLVLSCAVILINGLSAGYALDKDLNQAEQTMLDQEVSKIRSWGRDPKIVAFVRDKNSSGETLDQVKERDKAWVATPGLDSFMKQYLNNECAMYLRELQRADPVIVELFVMDLNGAIVGEANKTSDYWQGDEDKHIKTTQAGDAGAIFIDKIKYDESSQIFSRQVSVPVIDPDTGKPIGAITAGVALDKLSKYSR